jgi:hypothetical protein
MSNHEAANVSHVFNLITSYLGESFTLSEITQFVEQCRGKEVILVEQALPVGTTGFCFAFKDVDLIVVRQGLDPVRRIAACLHECSHFLLQHIPRVSAGPTTPSFEEFTQSVPLQQVVYRSQETAYDTLQEQTAETLATLLMQCMRQGERNQQRGADLARQLYGYGVTE